MLDGGASQSVIQFDGLVGGDALLVNRAFRAQPEVDVLGEGAVAVKVIYI